LIALEAVDHLPKISFMMSATFKAKDRVDLLYLNDPTDHRPPPGFGAAPGHDSEWVDLTGDVAKLAINGEYADANAGQLSGLRDASMCEEHAN
jgi:hypothetical protein